MNDSTTDQGFGLYEWINRHAWSLAAALVIGAVILAGLFPVLADEGEPSFDPKGEIYTTHSHVTDTFATTSPIRSVSFIVESPDGGDVLTRDSLLELKQNQDLLLVDAESQQYLAMSFDRGLGIPGRWLLLDCQCR